jgi:hypothetical protein
LYDTNMPAQFVRFVGQPLVGATCYEQRVLRCSSCQQRFPAPLLEGVPAEKYDATTDVAVVMAKYAAGRPAGPSTVSPACRSRLVCLCRNRCRGSERKSWRMHFCRCIFTFVP